MFPPSSCVPFTCLHVPDVNLLSSCFCYVPVPTYDGSGAAVLMCTAISTFFIRAVVEGVLDVIVATLGVRHQYYFIISIHPFPPFSFFPPSILNTFHTFTTSQWVGPGRDARSQSCFLLLVFSCLVLFSTL